MTTEEIRPKVLPEEVTSGERKRLGQRCCLGPEVLPRAGGVAWRRRRCLGRAAWLRDGGVAGEIEDDEVGTIHGFRLRASM